MALITYLAEDNQTILDNLIETLEEISHVKVAAHAATQAEATRWLTLQDGSWHLAIVDLFLKEGSGLGVFAGCRNREPYQKVAVLTNYATPDIRRLACDLGADAVFDKTTELDALYIYCTEQTRNISREDVKEAQREALVYVPGLASLSFERKTTTGVVRRLHRMLQLGDVLTVMQPAQPGEQVRKFRDEGVGVHGRGHQISVVSSGRKSGGHRRIRPMAGSVRLGRPVST